MRKAFFLITTVIRLVNKEKKNTFVAMFLLFISSLCCVFLISLGKYHAIQNRQNNTDSCLWIFIGRGECESIDNLLNELSKKYELDSFVISTDVNTKTYSLRNERTNKVSIGAELQNNDLFFCHYGTIELDNDCNMICTGGFMGDEENVSLNDQNCKITGFVAHKKLAFTERAEQPYFFVNLHTYEKIEPNINRIFVVLKKALPESDYDNFLQIIQQFFQVEDVDAPVIQENELEVERLEMEASIFLMSLSFVNIYAVIAFFIEKVRYDLMVIRFCGASKMFIFLIVYTYMNSVILFSYVFSCIAYYILNIITRNTSYCYPMDFYVFIIGLAILLLPSIVGAIRIRRDCNSII